MSRKERLFKELQKRGLFWSYAADACLSDIGDSNLIETCLRYADWPDLKQLFQVFDTEQLLLVWNTRVKPDPRFKKQNLLIARVLFGLDIEAYDLDGVCYERDQKLRFLAG